MRYILNIHGYNGNRENNIFRVLKSMDFEKETRILTIQLNNKPKTDFQMLIDLIKTVDDSMVITSKSLGSFYGCLLNKYYKIPCICFNPSFDPLKNIKFLNDDHNFILDHDYKNFDFDFGITCFMSLDDKRIDHRKNITNYKFLKYTDNIIVKDYDHDFNYIEEDSWLVDTFKNKVNSYFN